MVLRRLASPMGLNGLEEAFALYKSQLPEMFWEALMVFMSKQLRRDKKEMQAIFWNSRYESEAAAEHRKIHALRNVVTFSDSANLMIARPSSDNINQRVAYNGYEYNFEHAITFQALNKSRSIEVHITCLTEGCRRDGTLYES